MDKGQEKKSGNMFTKLKKTFLNTFGGNDNAPAKPDKVTLIVGRHDYAPNRDLSGYGAAYAFLVGKLLCDYCGTSYPEHIFYSPLPRARETALEHKLAMEMSDITPPTMSYDTGFLEKATLPEVQKSLSDALTYAEAAGMATIEIIGHEPTVNMIGTLLHIPTDKVGYGGIMVVAADNWQELRKGNFVSTVFESSKQFATEALGEDQVALLDKFMHYGKPNYSQDIKIDDLPELMAEQRKKAKIWDKQQEKGEQTAGKYSPLEFLTAVDAYRCFLAGQMAVVGVAPREDGPFMSEMQKKLFGENQAMKDFVERVEGPNQEENETYSVFNAVASMIAQKKGIKADLVDEKRVEAMEDFPAYRKIVHAGEDRVFEDGKEVAKSSIASYQITDKEQKEHDRIAAVVRGFKEAQR